MTGSTEFKLLLSDVDGTLVTNDRLLTPAAIAAVKSLAEAGIGFALTSARPPYGMRMLVEPLGLLLPVAGFNGGLIVDTDLKVLESHPIEPKAAQDGARLMQDSGLDLWVYTEHDWVVTTNDGPHVGREAWIIGMEPIVRRPTPADFSRAFKIVGVSDDHRKVAAAKELVDAHLGNTVSASCSEPHFLDITHPDANKGAVVHAMGRRLNLPRSRIAAIGDMPNDIPMFAQSGFSIAMGNASAEVKGAATVVTASNEQNGFAEAVHKFVLGPKSRKLA